mgnify:CR=1
SLSKKHTVVRRSDVRRFHQFHQSFERSREKMKRGRLRWASNVSEFDPEGKERSKEFLELLSLCSDSKEEKDKVMG